MRLDESERAELLEGLSTSLYGAPRLNPTSDFLGRVRRVNGLLGLLTPALVTPLELLGDTDDED
jgi:hypothetical protein